MKKLLTADVIRRRVLVVDDEMINRELLGAILSADYEVAFAENGRRALELLEIPDADYSLVLLDLLMPEIDGFEVIERCQASERLRRIPIIVMTSEKSAEVRSIKLGAVDFITKPYDMPEVILARCQRVIELSEDRSLIRSTERDPLTGLYTESYFFAYIRRLAPRLKKPMDAMALQIDRLRLVNHLFGREEGDRVLRSVAAMLSRMLTQSLGIACRTDRGRFFVYCEHREDYETLVTGIMSELSSSAPGRTLHVRTGVYENLTDALEPESAFDRAKAACDRIRSRYDVCVAYYDHELYEKALLHGRLIGGLDDAIGQRQLTVWFQPKYRIQGDRPVLASAEALVRWIHPELGFISPGEFIPLFEGNGLIGKVDEYVWREAAAQIRRFKEQYGFSLSVSVNVSRVDIFDPELSAKLSAILAENHLSHGELMLEITESAYSDNADRLIEVVNGLRDSGFRIEMDDFGSGYSSLNMLTAIPIDVLKLDMQFIRHMLLDEKSMRLVRLVLDIADFLGVPAVAEGVEEKEQLDVLREMGCELVQGYYFSPPLPAEKFGALIEKELEERKRENHDHD